MTVRGVVEEIIFRNDGNGYTVFYLERSDEEEVITVVGNFPELYEGAVLELEGEYKSSAKYGMQFSATNVRFGSPDGEDAIVRFLSSGLIKGVGAVLAYRIFQRFGGDALTVLEFNPSKLSEIKGISPKKAKEIGESYKEGKVVQNAVMFLGSHDISLNLALRIFSVYKSDTEEVVRQNPYRLVEDVDGIGFFTADKIADKIGISKTSDFRLRAGVLYVLSQASENGHTYLPKDMLIGEAADLLECAPERLASVVATLEGAGKLKAIDADGIEGRAHPNFYHYEKVVADKLTLIGSGFKRSEDVSSEILSYQKINDIELHPAQKLAVSEACGGGVTIITGGPGTGKTTIIKCIISILKRRKEKILLAAPTGRAAKRLSEACGEDAMTIHRALMSEGSEGRFYYNESNPLPFSTIIIDEVSMVDAFLMCALVKAVEQGSRLVLVGDSDQLPSVGAGNVLSDIVHSNYFETVRLQHVYRQGAGSMIIDNAHRINTGLMPELGGSDFFFATATEQKQIEADIISMCASRIPGYLGITSAQIQVLSPLKSGICGTDNLNRELQRVLNPPDKTKNEITVGKRLFREGDKVMHTANRYKLEWYEVLPSGARIDGEGVFNGDIGMIRSINPSTGVVEVLFDDNRVTAYTREDILDLMLSYAITIHKSQGSEFEVVIVPIIGGSPVLLTRNLLYTAVTRAKRMVVLVGDKYNLKRMIDNNRTTERFTMLGTMLDLAQERYKKLNKFSTD